MVAGEIAGQRRDLMTGMESSEVLSHQSPAARGQRQGSECEVAMLKHLAEHATGASSTQTAFTDRKVFTVDSTAALVLDHCGESKLWSG